MENISCRWIKTFWLFWPTCEK